MIGLLRKHIFKHPLDSPLRTMEHSELIRKKKALYKLYLQWYQILFDEQPDHKNQTIVELGSGGGFLKELAGHVITSDYLPLTSTDLIFSALEMPFDQLSIDAIFMIDTFHHLPDCRLFLKEAIRVLRPGGKIIMIEPANSWWGRNIYQRYHHEPFDPEGKWSLDGNGGPLSSANGALPWIVFERDRLIFNRDFSSLTIEKIEYHTPFLYLLTGGLTFHQIIPDLSYGFFRQLDSLVSRLSKEFSMFMTIVLQKEIREND